MPVYAHDTSTSSCGSQPDKHELKQQWRGFCVGNYKDDEREWNGQTTGDYPRLNLLIWDANTEGKIAKAMDRAIRVRRWFTIKRQIETVKPEQLTDSMLAAIEGALP